MKTMGFIAAAIIISAVSPSCENANGRYVDLNTGERIDLKKDAETGLMVHAETGKPVNLYVDTKTKDTIYGKTGKVINGKVRKGGNGVYVYNSDVELHRESSGNYGAKPSDGEYKIKKGDYKKEVEKDGDITIKDGDKKVKVDGETGERKVKYDD